MNNLRAVQRINDFELEQTASNRNSGGSSWHDDYKDSNWIYCGQLNNGLTEGDLECVFSQYGTVQTVQLVRHRDGDKKGQSKGFGFIEYLDFRSCILAVDNFNGISLAGRMIRVDHASPPRHSLANHGDDDMKKDPDQSQSYKQERNIDRCRSRSPPSSRTRQPVDPYLAEQMGRADERHLHDMKAEIAAELRLDEEDPMYDYLIEKELKKRQRNR